MDEARSLSYSINVRADTSQAESNLRNITSSLGNLQNNNSSRITVGADTSQAEAGIRSVTSGLGNLQTQAGSVGSAFRSSFLESVDSGNSLASSLRAGVGGAFDFVGSRVTGFRNNVVSAAQNIGHGFALPIETIRGGLTGAIEKAKSKFIDLVRGADDASEATDEVGESATDAKKDVSNLGDSAEKSSGKFEKLGSVLKGIGTAIGAVSAAAVAGAVALSTQVVSASADYEQFVGGIDTLFGTASQEVQSFAADAYKTAGLSANEYMELTTSFSASLIGSLGGDTSKAAKYADQAITDMSDNANKMGTSIESLQNAYRGFSVGNYTMLDNLKLGYSGTQDEMQRLLDDAGKLAGTKFDISSYADITEAIHVIQTDMGIAGTTAKEAAETISGSMASTKSAIGNLIAGLGNANADIGHLTDNVIESFGNVVDNIVPIVENLVGALPGVVNSVIPAISSMLPQLLDVAETLFGEVLNTLVQLVPELVPVALSAVGTIADTIVSNLPLLIETAAQIIVSLTTGLANSLPTLIPTVVETLVTVVGTLIDNLPLIIDAGMKLIDGLAQGIMDAIPMLIEQLPELIISIMDFLTENLPTIIEQGVQIVSNLAMGLINAIPLLVAQLPALITSVVDFVTENLPAIIEQGTQLVLNLTMGLIDAIPLLVEQLPALITSIIDFVTENLPIIIEQGVQLVLNLAVGLMNAIPLLVAQLPALISSIVGFVSENLPAIIETGVNLVIQLTTGIIQAIPQLVAQLPQLITAIIGGLAELPKMMIDIGGNLVKGLWEGIKGLAGWIWDQVSGWASDLWEGICGFFGIHSPSKKFEFAGEMMVEGLAGAINKDGDKAVDAAETMSEGISDAVSLTPCEINPIINDVNGVAPTVSDTTYGVKAVVEDFNPPDVSASAVYSTETEADYNAAANGSEGTKESSYEGVSTFSPVININVNGDMGEEGIENISESLRETVRQLYLEFREEELERMALKQQYAF